MKAVNLIPADERAGVGGAAGRSGGAVWVLVGGLASLVIMAGLYALSMRHAADARAKDAAAVSQTAGARARAAQLAPYQQFFTAGHTRITQVATLVKGRYDWSGVMHGIAVTLPSDVSLTTLTASLSAAGATAAAPGSSVPATPAPATSAATGTTRATAAQVSPTVLLGGCARNHPEVAHVLDALGGMDGVQNVSFASSTKGATTQAAGGAAGAGGACPPSSPAVFQVTITLHATGATGALVSPAIAAQSAASPSVAAANAPVTLSVRPPAPVAPGALGAAR